MHLGPLDPDFVMKDEPQLIPQSTIRAQLVSGKSSLHAPSNMRLINGTPVSYALSSVSFMGPDFEFLFIKVFARLKTITIWGATLNAPPNSYGSHNELIQQPTSMSQRGLQRMNNIGRDQLWDVKRHTSILFVKGLHINPAQPIHPNIVVHGCLVHSFRHLFNDSVMRNEAENNKQFNILEAYYVG